jgi:hypothetical protein
VKLLGRVWLVPDRLLGFTPSPRQPLHRRDWCIEKIISKNFRKKKRRFRERLLSIFEILYCSEKVVEFWLWERLSVTVRKGPREVPYEPLRTVCFALGCHTFPYKTATVANDRCEPNAALALSPSSAPAPASPTPRTFAMDQIQTLIDGNIVRLLPAPYKPIKLTCVPGLRRSTLRRAAHHTPPRLRRRLFPLPPSSRR